MNEDTALLARFWAKVDRRGDDECWLWTAAHGKYGQFRIPGGRVTAHRFSYEILVGPIPDGLQVDHLCRVKLCVNPAHLEPVTGTENNRRSSSPSAVFAQATHCVKGHSFDDAKVNDRGWRLCRVCVRERKRDSRAKARTAI